MQITKPALTDYNAYHKTTYTVDDLYNPNVNLKIGKWYLLKRCPQLLRAHGIPVTLDNILWTYNAGIGRVIKGIMPKETEDYIKRVKKRLKYDKK